MYECLITKNLDDKERGDQKLRDVICGQSHTKDTSMTIVRKHKSGKEPSKNDVTQSFDPIIHVICYEVKPHVQFFPGTL